MKPKKSKYEEMLARAKAEKAKRPKEEKVVPAISEAQASELDILIKQAEETVALVKLAAETPVVEVPVEEPASPGSQYATKKQEEEGLRALKETLHPEARKAYNIWFDTNNRYYFMDIIEYDGTNVLSIKTERMTVSQAVAMAGIQKIFTQKLILRKKGV